MFEGLYWIMIFVGRRNLNILPSAESSPVKPTYGEYEF